MDNAKLFLSRIRPKFTIGSDPMSDFSISLELNTKGNDIDEMLQLLERIAQNSPLFEKQTENLSAYQMNFLRALVDGVHREFTSAEILQKYQLGSSANVSIIKRALIKKELIETENNQVLLADPVMKLWLKQVLTIN